MINTADFAKRYAKTYGVSNKYAATVCESVFRLLGTMLYEENEDVSIYRFGSFKHTKMAEKRAKHPGTGEMITIPERDVIKFKRTESTVNETTEE